LARELKKLEAIVSEAETELGDREREKIKKYFLDLSPESCSAAPRKPIFDGFKNGLLACFAYSANLTKDAETTITAIQKLIEFSS